MTPIPVCSNSESRTENVFSNYESAAHCQYELTNSYSISHYILKPTLFHYEKKYKVEPFPRSYGCTLEPINGDVWTPLQANRTFVEHEMSSFFLQTTGLDLAVDCANSLTWIDPTSSYNILLSPSWWGGDFFYVTSQSFTIQESADPDAPRIIFRGAQGLFGQFVY